MCAGVLISISVPAPGAPSTLGRAARFTVALGCFLSRPNTLLLLSANPGDRRSWQSLCSFSVSGRWGPALVLASPLPPTDSLSLWIHSPVSLSPGGGDKDESWEGEALSQGGGTGPACLPFPTRPWAVPITPASFSSTARVDLDRRLLLCLVSHCSSGVPETTPRSSDSREEVSKAVTLPQAQSTPGKGHR